MFPVGAAVVQPNVYNVDYLGVKYLAIKVSEVSGSSHRFTFRGSIWNDISTSMPRIVLESETTNASIFQSTQRTGYNIYETRTGNVGVGTTSPQQKISVAGTVESTSGGFKFPDGTIQTTAASGESSLGVNGYQKLPSGLIMQWGVLTNVSLNQTFHPVTFPIAFPNAVFNVQATISRSTVIGGTVAPLTRNMSTTGVEIAGDYDTDVSTGSIYWTALGR